MAKGPGPALLIAAAAAFVLMGRKKETPKLGEIDPAGDAGDSGASDADVGGGPADGGGGGGGGGSQPKNPKTVPNSSGHSKGYDAQRWQDGYDVRVGFAALGYLPVSALIEAPLTDEQARAAVRAFQKDYNAGDVTVELGPFAGDAVPGYLDEDEGIAGKNVLNALGIVIDGFPEEKWAGYYS